jgi:polygalacturonase
MMGAKRMICTTATHSGPSQSYGIVSGGFVLAVIIALCLSTQPASANHTPPLPNINTNLIFDVTNTVFAGGALGNGISNSTAAIQAAINTASTASASGATVRIRAVGVNTNYLCGPLKMASHVNLMIDSGTKLQMFPMSSWPSTDSNFINGATLTDAEISGTGTIDGQGTNWWFPLASSRPNFIEFDHCTRVLIQDVTLQNPPTFTIYLKNSDTSVTIQRITINTPFDSHNTDGFDISSTNVLIQNSFISTGDDNVELGGSSAAATDITISNCTFGTGHGLSIGSKIGGGVNNLIVSNCSWNGTTTGIKIKSDRADGGVVQNLNYTDLTMTNVNVPIAIYMDYDVIGAPMKSFTISPANAAADVSQSSTVPVYRNITITNLMAVGNNGIQGPGNIAGIIYGIPESPVTNITLYNVNILGRTNDGTFCVYHARNIQIVNSNLTAPSTGTNTFTLYDAGIIITNGTANTNLVSLGGLGSPSNTVLSFFNATAAINDSTVTPMNLFGAGTITLGNSTLILSQDSVSFSNNLNIVSSSTLGLTSGSNTYSGALSGAGAMTVNLPGTSIETLLGNSLGFTGGLVVTNTGTLLVNNTAGNGTGSGAVNVLSGATLGGKGVIGGPTTVIGTLAPGNSPGTLTVSNNLVAGGTAILQYDLGANNDLTIVKGNLTLGGTLNISNSGGFTNGTYTLLTYSGTFTYNGLSIGIAPGGFGYTIDTGTVGQVNLVVDNTTPQQDPFVTWQLLYFGSTNCALCGGDTDFDGDGISNTNEFLAGTNPTNSASGLRIISVVRQNTDIAITWTTAGGFTNAVQATTGSYSTNFTDLTGPIVIPGNGDVTNNYVDTGGATNIPSRYYRIRLVQ